MKILEILGACVLLIVTILCALRLDRAIESYRQEQGFVPATIWRYGPAPNYPPATTEERPMPMPSPPQEPAPAARLPTAREIEREILFVGSKP